MQKHYVLLLHCKYLSCLWFKSCVYVPVSVLIALSEPLGCRSRCCRRSLLLSFVEQMQLFWQPSGASWPPVVVSLSSPMSDLWPEGGDGVGPWVAFLALEVGAASPVGRSCWGEGRTFQEKDIFVCVYVTVFVSVSGCHIRLPYLSHNCP